MKRFGLQAKFIALTGLILTAIFTALTLAVLQTYTSSLRDNLLEQATAFAEIATPPIGNAYILYKDSGRIKILQEIERFTDLNPHIANVAVIDISGEVVFNQHDDTITHVTRQQAATFVPLVLNESEDRLTTIIVPYVEDFGFRRYAVIYHVSNEEIDRNVSLVTSIIIGLGLAGLAVTIGLIYFFINRFFLSPLKKVGEAATEVSRGHYDYPIELERNDEIGDLANAVESMGNRLKADIRKLQEVDELKTEFMMITSHNIRTPLGIINGYLELIGEEKVGKGVKKMLDIISMTTKRLRTFAEDILTISSIEAGSNVVIKEPGDLRQAILPIAQDYAELAQEKNIAFTARIQDSPLPANFSKAHITSAVWNLLDNAYKFTQGGGNITFSVKALRDTAVIMVEDTGIGIAPEELPKLFTKFHRGTSTLVYDYEGRGIGLYITKLIISQHGGTIDVKSQLKKGTTFTVTLPLSAMKQAKAPPTSK